jgi:hypothetical protein
MEAKAGKVVLRGSSDSRRCFDRTVVDPGDRWV